MALPPPICCAHRAKDPMKLTRKWYQQESIFALKLGSRGTSMYVDEYIRCSSGLFRNVELGTLIFAFYCARYVGGRLLFGGELALIPGP